MKTKEILRLTQIIFLITMSCFAVKGCNYMNIDELESDLSHYKGEANRWRLNHIETLEQLNKLKSEYYNFMYDNCEVTYTSCVQEVINIDETICIGDFVYNQLARDSKKYIKSKAKCDE